MFSLISVLKIWNCGNSFCAPPGNFHLLIGVKICLWSDKKLVLPEPEWLKVGYGYPHLSLEKTHCHFFIMKYLIFHLSLQWARFWYLQFNSERPSSLASCYSSSCSMEHGPRGMKLGRGGWGAVRDDDCLWSVPKGWEETEHFQNAIAYLQVVLDSLSLYIQQCKKSFIRNCILGFRECGLWCAPENLEVYLAVICGGRCIKWHANYSTHMTVQIVWKKKMGLTGGCSKAVKSKVFIKF